jgi:PIN domain nuclease of toxin-antitoxin system
VKLLLDTHVLLWWLNEEPITTEAQQAIASPKNAVCVSAASAWEMGIKVGLGKLQVPERLSARLGSERFTPLPVTIDHGLRVGELPMLHRDPFDRLLVAQAQLEGLTIVTRDPRIARYDVETLAA